MNNKHHAFLLCRYHLIPPWISKVNIIKDAQWNDYLMNIFGSRKLGILPCDWNMNLIKHFLQLENPSFARRKCEKPWWQLLGIIYHEALTYFPFQKYTTLFILWCQLNSHSSSFRAFAYLLCCFFFCFVFKFGVLSSELGGMWGLVSLWLLKPLKFMAV